jgi:hypothetical protein
MSEAKWCGHDSRAREIPNNDLPEIAKRFEAFKNGKPFNPLKNPEVNTAIPLEQRPVGGLGIHLMRRFMDELEYRRESGQNVLTMRKHLPGAPA